MCSSLLDDEPSACNLVHLPGAARRPEGDLVLVDLAREEASVVLSDLRDLGVEREGSISVLEVDFHVSDRMERAVREADGSPADAVVWEEVTSRTSETAELNWTFAAFMVLAGLIAAVGILLDTPILIVGAMVVGPEFGPVAGICVALVQRRPALALRSLLALAVGFPAAIATVTVACLVFKAIGVSPENFDAASHSLSSIIASPDFFAFFVAFCAGVAGILSLTSAKSGALIGVLISVTTIPAAANVGVGAAYGEWASARGSLEQLAINLLSLIVRRDAHAPVPARRLRAQEDEAPPRDAATAAPARQAVRMSGRPSRTTSVCSAWAETLPSSVEIVQPSSSVTVVRVDWAMIGSIVMTRPSVRVSTSSWSAKFGTVGPSWIVRPMPWPVSSRSTRAPRRSTAASTIPPSSAFVMPGRTAASASFSALCAVATSRLTPGFTRPTGTETAASAKKPSRSTVTSSLTSWPSRRRRGPGMPWTASSSTEMQIAPGKS